MDRAVQEISDLVPIDKTLIRILLNRFRWDTDALVEQYFNYDNPAEFLANTILPDIDKNLRDAPIISLRAKYIYHSNGLFRIFLN